MFIKPNSNRSALIVSIVLHGLVLLILVLAYSIQTALSPEQTAPNVAPIIQATMIDVSNIEPAPASPTPMKPAPAPTPEPEKTVLKPAPQKDVVPIKVMPKPPKKVEKKKAPPKKPEVKKPEVKKPVEKPLKKTPKAKASPVTKPPAKKALDKKKAQEQLAEMAKASIAAQVAAQQKAEAAQAQLQAEASAYATLVNQKITDNWTNPFAGQGDLQVQVQIQLDKDGNVLNTQVIQGSGNENFDRQVILAIRKSSPLPLPDDPSLLNQLNYVLVLNFYNQ